METTIVLEKEKIIEEKEVTYQKIDNEINNSWPEWKKKVYNEMFAVSIHAKKVNV